MSNMKVEKIKIIGDRELYIGFNSYFDETKPYGYLVEYNCGQYDTYVSGPVSLYHKLDDAVDFIRKHYQWKEDIERLAIKNLYNLYGDYNTEIEDDPDFPNCEQYPFTKIENEWKDYCFQQMFPGKTWDDIDREAEETYFELTDDEDKFVEWIVKEKNISEEVAKASIIYNTSGEHSEYATDYTIVKINIE